jgi:hypothetical protein
MEVRYAGAGQRHGLTVDDGGVDRQEAITILAADE